MKPFKTLWLAVAAVLLLAATLPARAQQDPLKVIPKDAEAIIGINVKLIANSDLFKKLTEMHPEINAQLQVIQNLTGINIPQDAERLVLFGQMSKKENSGILFVGKYDKEKMLTLIKASPRFKETTIDNMKSYEWYDGKEKRIKYAAVVSDDLTAVFNSKAVGEAALAALRDPAQSFSASPEAQLIPKNAAEAAVWALAVNRSDKGPAAKYKIAALFATVSLGGANVTLKAGLVPQNAADAAKWIDVAKGLIAVAQLQPDKPEIQQIAAGAQAAIDGNAATLTLAVDQAKVLAVIGKKKPAPKP